MFTLGLEFSFKKLMNSGSSAVITALIIICGMTFAGFGVGKLLDLNTINCIFLGGMISMSSTTIILKTLTDLGMRHKKFASLVLAVLIIEDLFAVLMLVLLSSLAMGNVEGMDLLYSVAKLVFFLIIWFVVGVYVLPTLLTKMRMYLNDETLLIVAMGLCFSILCSPSRVAFPLSSEPLSWARSLPGRWLRKGWKRWCNLGQEPIRGDLLHIRRHDGGSQRDSHVLERDTSLGCGGHHRNDILRHVGDARDEPVAAGGNRKRVHLDSNRRVLLHHSIARHESGSA